MRIEHPKGIRGSLRWIQQAVAERWSALDEPLIAACGASRLDWLSPIATDAYAEYRDEALLGLVGALHLADPMQSFWPGRGPLWDAVAKSDAGDVLLVDAKASIGELLVPGTAASGVARERIEAVFTTLAARLDASDRRAPWTEHFYPLAVRLAHLDFLRRSGLSAFLVLVDFVGDAETGGPETAEAWDAAYQVAFNVMGLPRRHALSSHVVHVRPDVRAHL
jgi:hypothetical protein